MPGFAAPTAGGAHPPSPDDERPHAVVVVRDDDLRLLVRGLLLLEHVAVILEGPGPEVLRRYTPLGARTLLVLDAETYGERWREEIAELRRTHPELRLVMLFAHASPHELEEAKAAGAHAALVRPIVLSAFVSAIGLALAPA